MKNQPQPSDEEIHRYMNFDELLANRPAALKRHRIISFLKWGVPSFLFTGVVLWFVIVREPGKPIVSEPHIQKEGTPNVAATPLYVDSIVAMKSKDAAKSINAQPQRAKKPEISPATSPASKEESYIQAEPQRGYASLYDYFAVNLRYPSAALVDSIQGVQTISFIINTNGTPEKITITNSLGEAFDKEARRLIETMPPWNPATLNGRPVASKVSLPLTFQIQKIKK